MEINKVNVHIALNSVIYFLIAYYFVVFSSNLFTIALAKIVGFNAELFYHGFSLTNKKWTNDNIVLVYFFGNIITLLIAIIFQRLYSVERRYQKKIKIFYLWVYIISISWFLGNIIVGAIFLTGMGAALIAFRVPFFLRALLAIISVVLLLYLGKKSQKHVRVSANLYFQSLSSKKFVYFFINQILFPSIVGFVIILLLKLPNLSQYHYVDLFMLLSLGLFIVGLFLHYRTIGSITFKSYKNSNNPTPGDNGISYIPIIILVIIITSIRVGLMNGVAI